MRSALVMAVLGAAAGTAAAVALGSAMRDALAAATAAGLATAWAATILLGAGPRDGRSPTAGGDSAVDWLSEELAGQNGPNEVARAIERAMHQRLPCDFLGVTLAPACEPPSSSRDGAGSLGSMGNEPGYHDPSTHRFPMVFGSAQLGWIDVRGPRGRSELREDDRRLLRAAATHGALALAHSLAYQELEERRRRQALAWRGEREALVETVAAEIAHEIRYPLNYFRSLFQRGTKAGSLTPDDIDVGREEVDRLERLVAGLRRMVAPRTERSATRLAEICARVETLLHDTLSGRRVQLEVDAATTLRCDPDKLTQILVNLYSNAIDACPAGGRLGVGWQATPEGGELTVWDEGPGFAEPARLFNPWYTTKPRGTGLGLAITHRLVRAHGWTISALRRDGRTVFAIKVRAEDVLRAVPRRDAEGGSSDVQVA